MSFNDIFIRCSLVIYQSFGFVFLRAISVVVESLGIFHPVIHISIGRFFLPIFQIFFWFCLLNLLDCLLLPIESCHNKVSGNLGIGHGSLVFLFLERPEIVHGINVVSLCSLFPPGEGGLDWEFLNAFDEHIFFACHDLLPSLPLQGFIGIGVVFHGGGEVLGYAITSTVDISQVHHGLGIAVLGCFSPPFYGDGCTWLHADTLHADDTQTAHGFHIAGISPAS